VYVKAQGKDWPAPIRTLQAFQRITLAPKQRKTVEFILTGKQLDHAGHASAYEISVGGKQPGFKGSLDAVTTGVVSEVIRTQ
jgi:beta-glucosidase